MSFDCDDTVGEGQHDAALCHDPLTPEERQFVERERKVLWMWRPESIVSRWFAIIDRLAPKSHAQDCLTDAERASVAAIRAKFGTRIPRGYATLLRIIERLAGTTEDGS